MIQRMWRRAHGAVSAYAVGFARPDRQSWAQPAEQAMSWHVVESHRPADELDGEVELAVCGAISRGVGLAALGAGELGPQLLRGVPRAHRAGPRHAGDPGGQPAGTNSIAAPGRSPRRGQGRGGRRHGQQAVWTGAFWQATAPLGTFGARVVPASVVPGGQHDGHGHRGQGQHGERHDDEERAVGHAAQARAGACAIADIGGPSGRRGRLR